LFKKTGSRVIKNDRDETSFKFNLDDFSLSNAAGVETVFFGLRQVVLAGSQLLFDPMFTSRLSRSIPAEGYGNAQQNQGNRRENSTGRRD
jgi:hypothetical protein